MPNDVAAAGGDAGRPERRHDEARAGAHDDRAARLGRVAAALDAQLLRAELQLRAVVERGRRGDRDAVDERARRSSPRPRCARRRRCRRARCARARARRSGRRARRCCPARGRSSCRRRAARASGRRARARAARRRPRRASRRCRSSPPLARADDGSSCRARATPATAAGRPGCRPRSPAACCLVRLADRHPRELAVGLRAAARRPGRPRARGRPSATPPCTRARPAAWPPRAGSPLGLPR